MFWGIVFIVFGIVIWVLNFLGSGWNWGRDWPLLLILWGIYVITKAFNWRKTCSKRNKKNIKEILKDIESGKISAEEGLKKMEE